jgi:hypothetical protein
MDNLEGQPCFDFIFIFRSKVEKNVAIQYFTALRKSRNIVSFFSGSILLFKKIMKRV